jgi:hypothetical protein
MKITKKASTLVTLLLFAAAGCIDLDVQNPNDPDAERALQEAGDVESLIAGSFGRWFSGNWSTVALGPILSVQTFQHSAFPANFGMTFYSAFPREAIVNDPAHGFYSQWANPWTQHYRAIAAIRDGFRAIDEGTVTFPAAEERRLRAFGRFVLGLAHAELAAVFDQAFIVDETTDLDTIEPNSYTEVMAAGMGYFDQAIQLAGQGSFTIPTSWMSREVTNTELIRLAHSFKARYRAATARTPQERAAINWDAVIADADAGVTELWHMRIGDGWVGRFGAGYYQYQLSSAGTGLWSQMSYFVLGMADQSGRYQAWIERPIGDRHPEYNLADPVILVTPDQRFPQGNSLVEQMANPGTYYFVPPGTTTNPNRPQTGMWGQPARGSWRWSWYLHNRQKQWFLDQNSQDNPQYIWLNPDELRLLKAEGLFHKGDLAGAAALINVTRTANGLNATDASGTNTSCVPKLINGQCGGLFEMLKWEKRLETVQVGNIQMAGWFFDGRAWGDLYRGTQLEFPMPCRDMQVLQIACYAFGGVGGQRASTGSSYAYPFE